MKMKGEEKMEDKRFALLIDADNISARYIAGILEEMTKYGVTTYKRIYGDWTSTQATKWKEKLLEYSIMPIQQFSNTTGKNATDSTLIIDAMDILYTNKVEGFCIVSSDSDFTRLASRLRESGMEVIGMGEEKTPGSFRAACTIFTNLELLMDQDEEEKDREELENISVQKTDHAIIKKERSKNQGNQLQDKKMIENTIVNIITENENKGRGTGLGEIGSRLVKKYPDFDVRKYGYSLLSKFLEEITVLELEKKDSTIMVSLKENGESKNEIIQYIKEEVQKSTKRGADIGKLSNNVRNKYKNFNLKDYGYSQFSKFLQSIDGIEVRENANKRKRAYPL